LTIQRGGTEELIMDRTVDRKDMGEGNYKASREFDEAEAAFARTIKLGAAAHKPDSEWFRDKYTKHIMILLELGREAEAIAERDRIQEIFRERDEGVPHPFFKAPSVESVPPPPANDPLSF
jgi:hypothetical protein